MKNQQKDEIYQFLASNWHSRPENDSQIVEEILKNISQYKLGVLLDLTRNYLDGPESSSEKSKFIRESVQRYLSPEVDAPILWLKKMIYLLDSQQRKY